MSDRYAPRWDPRSVGILAVLALTFLLVTDVRAQRARTDSTRARTSESDRASEGRRTAERSTTERARGRTGQAGTTEPPSRTGPATMRERTPSDERRAERGTTQRQPRGAHREETQPSSRDRRSPSHSVPPRVEHRPDPPVWHHPPSRRPSPPPVVDVHWPWEHRYRTGWSPRYRYRQRVYVRTGYGVFRRSQEMDIHTTYRQRVRHASRGRADVEVVVERIELYRRGRFLGEVHHLPRHLRRITARIERGDRVSFDRDLFLVGAPGKGFELVATRHYSGYVLGAYERGHEVEVGVLDFRRERVVPVRHARLFEPYGRSPLVPVPLIPDDPDLLLDYDRPRITHRDDDGRDYRGYSYYSDPSPYWNGYEDDSDDVGTYVRENDAPGAATSGEVQIRTREQHMRTRQGSDVLLKREMQLERIE